MDAFLFLLILLSATTEGRDGLGDRTKEQPPITHDEIGQECEAVLRNFVQSKDFMALIAAKRDELERLVGECVKRNGFTSGYNSAIGACFDCTSYPKCETDTTCIAQCAEKKRIIMLEKKLQNAEREIAGLNILVIICLSGIGVFFVGQMMFNVLCWRNKQDCYDKKHSPEGDCKGKEETGLIVHPAE